MTEDEMKQLEDLCQQLSKLRELAKALWGKERCVNGVPLEAVARMAVNLKPEDGANTIKEVFGIPSQPMFEWHLQQMVISDNPLAYLGAHL